MIYNFDVIDPIHLGINPIDDTFPIIFKFHDGDFENWFVSVEGINKGKLSISVVGVPQNVSDKEIKKKTKQLSKVMGNIFQSIIEQDQQENNV